MSLREDEVSFREPSQEVPFIMTVGREGYIDVDERLLCLRFNFKDGNLMLVEREEFDEDMVLMRIIYQKPRTSSGVWRYRVTPGHYVVQWLGSPVSMFQQSTQTPSTISSFQWVTRGPIQDSLPTVFESPQIEVHCLSSDTSSPSGGDSESECAPDCVREENFADHRLVGSTDGTQERGSDVDSESDGEAGSESGAFGVGSSEEPTTPKFAVRSEVVRETITEAPLASTPNVESHDIALEMPLQSRRSLTVDFDSDAVVSETVSGFRRSLSDCESTLQSMSIGNLAPQHSLEGTFSSSSSSVMTLLLALKSMSGGRSDLRNANLVSFKHTVVESLPAEFNGDCIFELPPLPVVKAGGSCRLDGMDRRFDRHVWTETATSNISDPSGKLSFMYVKCMGHLRCNNLECRRLKECKDYNELYWTGSSAEVMTPDIRTVPLKRCNLLCKFCKVTPSCLALCPCKMYYIVSKDPQMSRACIHFGTHEHPVAKGNYRAAMEQIRDTVMAQVSKTPSVKSSAIEIAVGKELLMKGLIDEHGNGKALFRG